MIYLSFEELVAFLNELVRLDPAAIKELVKTKIGCNEALANHSSDGAPKIGLLGVLNGIVNINNSEEDIIIIFDEASGKFEKSEKVTSPIWLELKTESSPVIKVYKYCIHGKFLIGDCADCNTYKKY
jgi:hypothetical protein